MEGPLVFLAVFVIVALIFSLPTRAYYRFKHWRFQMAQDKRLAKIEQELQKKEKEKDNG